MDSAEPSRQLAASSLGRLAGDPLEDGGRRNRRRGGRWAPEEAPSLRPHEGRTATPRERWHLIVRGRVQGVGYRAACRRRAGELGLGGWVRNLPDGAVELEAEGSAAMLVDLQRWCEKGPPGAQVDDLRAIRVPLTGEDWFEIRRG